MIQEPVRVRLELESNPENVALVRAALTGFAEAAELDEELLADLKTAASEACNNAVLHAYPDGPGTIVVTMEALHDGVEVVVTDHGRGIVRIAAGEDRMGLGLAVISALSDRAEFLTPAGGGTEVRMGFNRATAVLPREVRVPWPRRATEAMRGDVVAWVSPVELSRFVLGRIFRAVAAASHFSVARFSDLYAVNDAIAEYAELAADGAVGVAISSSSRRLSMTGGPFVAAYAGAEDGTIVTPERAREMQARREELAETVDALSSETLHGQELLHLVVVDARPES